MSGVHETIRNAMARGSRDKKRIAKRCYKLILYWVEIVAERGAMKDRVRHNQLLRKICREINTLPLLFFFPLLPCCCFQWTKPTRSQKRKKSTDVIVYRSDICGRKQMGGVRISLERQTEATKNKK